MSDDGMVRGLWRRRGKPVPDLAPYVGRWVAVRHGTVVAHAATLGGIVDALAAMPRRKARRCEICYVAGEATHG